MNDSNSTVSQVGSVTRITHGASAQDAAPAQPGPSIRVGGEVTRWNASDLTAETGSRHASYQHSTAGVSGGSVLATLDRQGNAQSVELIPGVPSSRTTVASAIREGLLVRDAAGNLADAADLQQKVQASQTPQQQEQQQPQEEAGVFDAADDADWGAAIEPLSQPAYDAAVASGVAAALGMGDLEQTSKALASNAGIDPELASRYVAEGSAMYQRAVDRALAPLGLDGDRLQEAYDWMRQQSGHQLQDAVQRLVHTRDVSGFKTLARDFKVASPDQGQLSTLRSMGFEARIDRDTGDLMVRMGQGGWHSADAVTKAGRSASTAPVRASAAPATPATPPARTPASAPQTQRMTVDPVTGNTIPEHWLK
jgi:hypothetical protein